MIRRFLAAALYAIVVSILLLSSCVGPMVGYAQSPRWLLEEIDPEEIDRKSFFVAFLSNDPSEANQLHVTPLRKQKEIAAKYPDISFHLTEDELYYEWNGDGSANIRTTTEANGDQLIQVFVKGDTPWTSLSEYCVVDNTVYPLRYSQSSPLILFGVIIGVIIVSLVSKSVKRGINRLMHVDEIS